MPHVRDGQVGVSLLQLFAAKLAGQHNGRYMQELPRLEKNMGKG